MFQLRQLDRKERKNNVFIEESSCSDETISEVLLFYLS